MDEQKLKQINDRRTNVQRLVGLGYSVKQISTELESSERTIRRDLKAMELEISKAKIQSDIDDIEAEEEFDAKVLDDGDNEPLEYMCFTNQIVVRVGDEPKIITSDHENYELIETALNNEQWSVARGLCDIRKAIETLSEGLVTVNIDGTASFNDGLSDTKFSISSLKSVKRLIEYMQMGDTEKATETIAFINRVMSNPSNDIVQRIYDFCSASDIAIDKEGYIIAYKAVNGDYKDSYSGTIDNSVGKTVEVSRSMVDNNANNTCSFGLHVASVTYLRDFYYSSGKRALRVRVDPADVVAIPRDYNDAKMRCCKYEVIEDVTDAYLKNRI